jgi:hypothetical protein
MIEEQLTARSPLRAFDRAPASSPAPGRLALVAARAGTGKTALLVQLAIDAMLRGLPVVHVSVGETLPHVKQWYQGVFKDLTAGLPADQVREAWERAEPLRLLMAFRVAAFSVERLVERLRALDADKVFVPRLLVADGFRLEPALRDAVRVLADFAAQKDLDVWIAGRTPQEGDDVERTTAPLADLFASIVALEPAADSVALRVTKGVHPGAPRLRLDPGTMLVTAV